MLFIVMMTERTNVGMQQVLRPFLETRVRNPHSGDAQQKTIRVAPPNLAQLARHALVVHPREQSVIDGLIALLLAGIAIAMIGLFLCNGG